MRRRCTLAGLEFSRAKRHCRRALKIARNALGRNSLELSDVLGSLATIFEHQGLQRRAELLFMQSLNICELALGRNHIQTAKRFVSLASCYSNQARYVEAEKAFQTALESINNPH